MITSDLKDIDAIYAYANGSIRELTQIMCNDNELWSSGFEPLSIDFSYTGDIQSWTVPKSGLYLLTCRGAQGGNNGGQGGVTNQHVVLTQGATLYIVCGDRGGSESGTSPGGYNGGGKGVGKSGSYRAGGGGGCTHIATISGTLYSLGVENLPHVLAVAGGGGGASGADSNGPNKGKGGGLNGMNGTYSQGGTQTSGNAFGAGGGAHSGGGSGGGLYGGTGNTAGSGNGAGGSGYIMSDVTIYKGQTYENTTVTGGNFGKGSATITRIA